MLLILMSSLDRKQSLFCPELRREERSEERKTIVTTSVTCEMRAEKPQAASSAGGSWLCISRSQAHDPPGLRELRSSLRSSPRIFEQKRDSSQSMPSTKKFACNVREQLFLF